MHSIMQFRKIFLLFGDNFVYIFLTCPAVRLRPQRYLVTFLSLAVSRLQVCSSPWKTVVKKTVVLTGVVRVFSVTSTPSTASSDRDPIDTLTGVKLFAWFAFQGTRRKRSVPDTVRTPRRLNTARNIVMLSVFRQVICSLTNLPGIDFLQGFPLKYNFATYNYI